MVHVVEMTPPLRSQNFQLLNPDTIPLTQLFRDGIIGISKVYPDIPIIVILWHFCDHEVK
jgi:hypothetical protein